MSVLVESVVDDLRKVFGEDFGEESTTGILLQEGVQRALEERRRGGLPPGPAMFRDRERFAQRNSGMHHKRKLARAEMRSRQKEQARQRNVGAENPVKKRMDLLRQGKAHKPVSHHVSSGATPVKHHAPAHSVPQAEPSAPTKSQGASKHNPFKRRTNLGQGPLGDFHNQVKCWNCKCGNIYSKGCKCVGTGKNKDCPEGKVKKIKIDRSYRQAYNGIYHSWQSKHKNAGGQQQTAQHAERG